MNTFLILSLIFSFSSGARLPATFKTCKRSEANFSKCLEAAIEDAFKQLKNPIPELGLPSIDPMVLTEVTLPIHHKQINLDERIHNLSMLGFSNVKISEAGVDFKRKIIHFVATVPQQSSKLDFEWVGTIQGEATNIRGIGLATENNGRFNITAKFEEYERNGDVYMKIVEFDAPWWADDPQFTVESADKDEADHVNKILQEHYLEIYAESERDYDNLTRTIFMHLANELFSRVPVKYIFLE